MEIIIDFMLLAASAAATFYCVVLSRKLENLKSTEKGLGATIASMSQTVEQARAAVALAKESSAESIEVLSPLVEETQEIMPKLTELIDIVSELAEISVSDINSTSTRAIKELTTHVDVARKACRVLQRQSAVIASAQDDNIAYLDDEDRSPPAASRISDAISTARKMQTTKKVAG